MAKKGGKERPKGLGVPMCWEVRRIVQVEGHGQRRMVVLRGCEEKMLKKEH